MYFAHPDLAIAVFVREGSKVLRQHEVHVLLVCGPHCPGSGDHAHQLMAVLVAEVGQEDEHRTVQGGYILLLMSGQCCSDCHVHASLAAGVVLAQKDKYRAGDED